MAEPACGVLLLSVASGHQRSMYANPLRRNPRVRIVAVAEEAGAPRDLKEAARSLASDLGVPYREDVEALIGSPEVRAISLCCPLDQRAEWVRRIAAHNKAIFVDKPICGNLADCAMIGQVVTATGIPLLVGHHTRWIGYVADMARELAQGTIGELIAVHGYLVPATGTSAYAQGELLNFLLYPFDTLRHLLGRDVESVYCTADAFFYDNAKQSRVEDLAYLSLNFAGGVCGTVVVGRTPTKCHLNGYGGEVNYRIVGSSGTLTQDGNRPAILVFNENAALAHKTAPDHLYTMLDHFVDCAIEGARPLVTWEDARASMAITAAAQRSARVRSVVRLDEILTSAGGD